MESGGHAVEIEFTPGGKYLLAFMIVGSLLLFSKFDVISTTLSERLGRRATPITVTFFMTTGAMTVLCSDFLVYGHMRSLYGASLQLLLAMLCLVLARGVKYLPAQTAEPTLSKMRVTQFFSSEVLIFGGAYLIICGLLIKLAILLGGSWHQFVSSLAAIGVLVLALLLISGTSIRERWTGFLERTLFPRKYDFRTELQSLTGAISTASTAEQLFGEICGSLRETFSTRRVCLLVQEDEAPTLRPYTMQEDGALQSHAYTIVLTEAQKAWTERINHCFSPKNLLALQEPNHESGALRAFLGAYEYELGSGLHAGQCLVGFVFLGGRDRSAPFSMEDKLLLETLIPAISISIHSAQLQQRMLLAQQMESIHRVVSFIMHDLRNAVSTLSLLARNARQHIDRRDFRIDFIATLARLSEEMQHLMNRLSVVKSGGELRVRDECDVSQLLSEALLDLQLPSEIELVTEISSMPAAFWDQRQIRVVLRNLLGNAVEAMPAGGVLKVSARQEGAEIVMTITDTGIGISDDFIRKSLFKPNHSTKSKGLGIGLYQSREIVLAHKGRIQVQSEVGKGSVFQIRLPYGIDNQASKQLVEETAGKIQLLQQQAADGQERREFMNLNPARVICGFPNNLTTSLAPSFV